MGVGFRSAEFRSHGEAHREGRGGRRGSGRGRKGGGPRAIVRARDFAPPQVRPRTVVRAGSNLAEANHLLRRHLEGGVGVGGFGESRGRARRAGRRRHGGGGWAVAASGRSRERGAVAAAIPAADALGEHVSVAARSGGAFARRGRVALGLVRGGSRHVDAESRERRGEVAAHGLDARLGRQVRDHLAQRGLARRRRRGRPRLRLRRRLRLRLERSLARLPRLHRVAAFLLQRERHHLPEMRLLVAVVCAPRRRGLEGRRHRDANVSRDALRPTRTRVATVADVVLGRVRGEVRPRLVPPPLLARVRQPFTMARREFALRFS